MGGRKSSKPRGREPTEWFHRGKESWLDRKNGTTGIEWLGLDWHDTRRAVANHQARRRTTSATPIERDRYERTNPSNWRLLELRSQQALAADAARRDSGPAPLKRSVRGQGDRWKLGHRTGKMRPS